MTLKNITLSGNISRDKWWIFFPDKNFTRRISPILRLNLNFTKSYASRVIYQNTYIEQMWWRFKKYQRNLSSCDEKPGETSEKKNGKVTNTYLSDENFIRCIPFHEIFVFVKHNKRYSNKRIKSWKIYWNWQWQG